LAPIERDLVASGLGLCPSCIQRTGVDDGLSRLLSREHDEQITYHRGPALFIEVEHTFALKAVQRHLDDPDSALHDLRSGRDDRRRLLSPQHRTRDLRGVSLVTDSRFDYMNTRLIDSRLSLLA